MQRTSRLLIVFVLVAFAVACSDDNGSATDPDADTNQTEPEPERPAAPEYDDVYTIAHGCYTVDAAEPNGVSASFLAPSDGGEGFAFSASEEDSKAKVFLQPSDLGTYLLYDDEEHYFGAENGDFFRKSEVLSDIFTLDDDFLPGVQWELEWSAHDDTRFQMRHLATGQYLGVDGLVAGEENAAVLTLYEADGCAEYPELTLDAIGEVEQRTFDDGSVFGFVETHSHIMTNFSFGGAGMFHGAPFHPLGVEHALPSCEMFHGEEGRADLLGYVFDNQDDLDEVDEAELIAALDEGETPEFHHHTDGYPTFTDWPSAHHSSTHQTQYYKWIQRAYLGGLRLMVQHATSNEILCELLHGSDVQPIRYSCNDMVAVDRILEETRNMERYIDAQSGGPGEGWFRIVESPQEAREVMENGKMAVVLGIEVSNLFDCFLVPETGEQRCDEQDVLDALDTYWDKGVRALFPVHKYDNGFSAGDGHRGPIELGNFAQTGHWSNFTEDCPDVPARFDQGGVVFGDLNEPRDDYHADPPVDMSTFGDDPMDALLSNAGRIIGDSLEGDYCQNAGLTGLGEFLMEEMMRRGMIIEVDHLPQRGFERAYELLDEYDYPAVGSHGGNNHGKLYEVGGVSKFNFSRCSDPDEPGTRADPLLHRVDQIEDTGGYPAEGFGFDLNGFAGAPGPRFGDDSVCDTDQDDPVDYPFESYAGDVEFTEPHLGERAVDFNTEGLVHIGMVPELIEDVRNDGVDDEQLEPLFRSAEGYLRMWEKAEQRGAALSE